MKYRVMMKTSYQVPVSIERLFDDHGDPFGLSLETLYIYGWPLWLAKEWFNRGHGAGKTGPKGRLP